MHNAEIQHLLSKSLGCVAHNVFKITLPFPITSYATSSSSKSTPCPGSPMHPTCCTGRGHRSHAAGITHPYASPDARITCFMAARFVEPYIVGCKGTTALGVATVHARPARTQFSDNPRIDRPSRRSSVRIDRLIDHSLCPPSIGLDSRSPSNMTCLTDTLRCLLIR